MDRRHCRVASHESDQQPLDGGGQADPRGNDLVDPGRDKAGAARHHEMSDVLDPDLRPQGVDRRDPEHRRCFAVDPHPRACSGQRVCIESTRGDRRPAVRSLRQHRPAVGDAAAPGHPVEQRAWPVAANLVARPADKSRVDVVRGDCGPDSIDVSRNGHACAFGAEGRH